MFKHLRRSLTHRGYDDRGMLIMLRDRETDDEAFARLNVSGDVVDMVLSGICESFDIEPCQKLQLRPSDNLADIYRAMTRCTIGDGMEYERLIMKIEEWIGEFDHKELMEDINVTVARVITFVNSRL